MGSRWLTGLLALLCMTAASACASAPRTLPHRIGTAPLSAVNGFSVMGLVQPRLDQQLRAMRERGVRIVRADAPWATIEPTAPGPQGPDWHLAETDRWVAALARHDLTWEPIIDYAVGWAKRCPGFCAPATNATYAAFAHEIAGRYGAGGSFWRQHRGLSYHPARTFEIWNEENTTAFRIAPGRYATLYLAARGAIHAVDGGARVIVGGLADDSEAFDPNTDYPAWYVEQMFAADPALRGNVDGFGLHPYGASASAVIQWVVQFRATLDQLGERSAPIDITEFGWTTGGPAREAWRALQMKEVALTLARSDCGIGMLAPYDWIDVSSGAADADFGLVRGTGAGSSLLPAGSAWFGGLSRATSLPELASCAGPAA